MSFDTRFAALFLVHLATALPSIAQETIKAAEPITLANVDQVGLLSETKRAARFIELGLGPNELLFYPPNGIVVVDDKNLKVLRRIDNEQTQGFSFSEDRSLTSWIQDKKVMIRDEKTGKTVEIDAGQRPGAAVFSPDNEVVAIGDMIITGSEGEGHSLLRVFAANSGELIRKLEISMKGYGSLSPVFSPDGKILAVGNRNYETKLFETETWKLRHTLPKRMTHEIAFSPDGKTLAAGYVDGTLALWDVETGKALHTVESGCYRIHSIAWNPTGDLLATSGPAGSKHGPNNTWIKLPGKVQLWNSKTFKVARDLMNVQWSGSVRFTRDGTRLISTVRKKDTLDDSPRIASWATNVSPMTETVKPKVAIPTIPVARSLSLPKVAAPTVAVSPDGQQVVAPLRNDRLAIWNVMTGEQELAMNGGHSWQVWRVAFSPDGKTVATASLDKTAKLWDAKTGDLLATMEGHTDRLKYVTYSHAGKYILTSTGKQWPYSKPGNVSARIWDAKTGEFITELGTHADTITSAKFNEDEALVLVASDDHTARLWEVASGKELHKFDLGSGIRSMAFSPDGKTILMSSSGARSHYVKTGPQRPKPSVKLWDATTGRQLMRRAHLQAVKASFNESGDQILTECRGLITYWNTASGEKLTTRREPLIGTEVIFSPNRKHFVVLTPEKPAELWSISEKKQIREMEIEKPFRSFFSRDSQTFYSLTRAGDFRSWSLDGLK